MHQFLPSPKKPRRKEGKDEEGLFISQNKPTPQPLPKRHAEKDNSATPHFSLSATNSSAAATQQDGSWQIALGEVSLQIEFKMHFQGECSFVSFTIHRRKEKQ